MKRNRYKFTFGDGSKSLAHHGVKGMKWGVWNAETRMKYKGAGKNPASPEGAGGGAALNQDDEENVSDYQELIRELSADGEEGYEDAARKILESERGKGNYDNDTLTDYQEIIREWAPDGEKGYRKAAEMIYESERKREGAKSATQLKSDRAEANAAERKRVEKALGKENVKASLSVSPYANEGPAAESRKSDAKKEDKKPGKMAVKPNALRHSNANGPVYKFTFQDGSEAIAHYGVKGMKWGMHLFGDVADALGKGAGGAAMALQEGVDKAREILEGRENEEQKPEANAEALENISEGAKEAMQQAPASQGLSDEQVTDLAYSVIRGDWGNGEERYNSLQDAGYSYEKVQTKVNDIIYGSNDYAEGRNTSGREDRGGGSASSDAQVHVSNEGAQKVKEGAQEITKKKRVG